MKCVLKRLGGVVEWNHSVFEARLDHAEINGTRAVDGLESFLKDPSTSMRADWLAFRTVGIATERVPRAKVGVVDALARRKSTSVRCCSANTERVATDTNVVVALLSSIKQPSRCWDWRSSRS